MELSSKNHAIEAMEVHYQLHSSALKTLLQFHTSSRQCQEEDLEEKKKRRLSKEAAIAKALVQIKGLPLSRHSYSALWEWTKDLCREAFGSSCGSSPSAGATRRSSVAKERDLLEIAEECSGEEAMDVDVIHKEVSPPPPAVAVQSYDQSCDQPDGGVTPTLLPQDYVSLFQLCLYGVSVCAVRCPAFFKPLYRLASTLLALGLPHVCRLCRTRNSLGILAWGGGDNVTLT